MIRLRSRIAYILDHDVVVGYGVAGDPGAYQGLEGGSVFLVYDARVEDLASRACEALEEALGRCRMLAVQGGEDFKTLDSVVGVVGWLLEEDADRGSIVAAVGGGSVTDTVGFAAAVYMRGVRWISMPTTLLAMADAGIGGKTGVNLDGKNIIGSFHYPSLVVADLSALDTMSDSDFLDGTAEIVKHSLIGGWTGKMESLAGPLRARDRRALEEAIALSVETKLRIVEADPREEKGERMKLNLGHTVAHALEAATGYDLTHGQAVAIGLVAEGYAAVEKVGLDPGVVEWTRDVLDSLGLPTRPPRSLDLGLVEAFMRRDKKKRGSTITLPLLEAPGRVRLVRLGLDEAVGLLMEGLRRAGSA